MMSFKRYVITGATGYIGSQLAKKLVADQYNIACIVRQSSDLTLLSDIIDDITIYKDNNKVSALADFLEQFKPDCIIHLASCYIAEHTPNEVDTLIQSNLLFGTKLLEAMSLAGIKKIINTGTNWQHYDNSPYDPVCLYAATKECFEKIITFYVNARSFSCITLKLFDTYGPNDPRKKIIHLFEKISKSGETIDMSSGNQSIDLVHINDILEAYLQAIKLLENTANYNETYGLSSGYPLKLKEIAQKYQIYTNKKLNINWGARPYRTREVMKPWTNFKSLPDWTPKYKFPHGLLEK